MSSDRGAGKASILGDGQTETNRGKQPRGAWIEFLVIDQKGVGGVVMTGNPVGWVCLFDDRKNNMWLQSYLTKTSRIRLKTCCVCV